MGAPLPVLPRTGDVLAAEAAVEEAGGCKRWGPEGASDPALIKMLLNDIRFAKEHLA